MSNGSTSYKVLIKIFNITDNQDEKNWRGEIKPCRRDIIGHVSTSEWYGSNERDSKTQV